ncbi:hypothetical protein [Brevifollis gellanilyticus]|uniref:Uncharacterized protein n=1 Tax=Brevifollis gellanilyticus TaxID=748831 RepID=A0A512MJB5_9BACT|nr:hypothetical protein [Brevifollis gellanilyticus]GEP46381.1 hypothetical protein BGE01nite_56720 [Brevifollis gellanilyticus]
MLGKILEALKGAGITRDGDDENTVLGAVGSLIQSIAWKREEAARQSRLATELRTALHPIVDVEDMPDRYLPEQAVAQLNALVSERAAMKSLIATLSAERDLMHNSRVNGAIAHALETGRITKADEDEERAELNADFDQAFNRLSAFRVQLNGQPLNLGGHKPALMEAAERMTRLNAWLDDYQTTHGCSRDTAWKASETDPQMRGIHEAMKAADCLREG